MAESGRILQVLLDYVTSERAKGKGTRMETDLNRRQLLQLAAAGGALYFVGPQVLALGAPAVRGKLISPGCRRTRVKVAKSFGVPGSPIRI
jgi:hypothetical protein